MCTPACYKPKCGGCPFYSNCANALPLPYTYTVTYTNSDAKQNISCNGCNNHGRS